MADQAESRRRAPPMTPPPPPPPSPALPEDSGSEAILWAASDDCSSSTPHTDSLSLWLSNYTAQFPEPEAEEEPLTGVTPTLLNFDIESSFPDPVDRHTTSTAVVTQAPVVTQQLWAQVHAPDEGEVDDLSRLALGIQSPEASILPLTLGIQSPNSSISPPALGIQFPEASVSPLALGIHPSPTSFEILSPEDPVPSSLALGIQPPPASSGIEEAPQASLSALALGLHPPQASFGTQSPRSSSRTPPPQAAISPLALETESDSILPLARGIRFPEASISPPISPSARGMQSQAQISFGIRSAPVRFSSLPSITCTLPVAPPSWNSLPSPSPVPESRSWSVISSAPVTPPPVRRQQVLLLPHSTSASMSSSSSHPSHQPRHFFPAPNTRYQQQVLVTYAPVTFSSPNASANFFAAESVPASRPSWSRAVAPCRSWTPNQTWNNNGQDMKPPIPQSQQFLLRPPAAAATVPAPPPLLANVGSPVGNAPNWNARGVTPARDQQRVPTGESSRASRKRSKPAARTG